MASLSEISIGRWYPADSFNLTFRKKRAIKAMFIGESGRFVTRILVPSKDAAKGEEVTFREGTYAFSKETALLDTDHYLPFCIYQIGNPQPLPVMEMSREDFLKRFQELGGQTALQYKKAFRAKLVADLLYQADADVHERMKQMWMMQIATLCILALIGIYFYQEIKDIGTLIRATAGLGG